MAEAKRAVADSEVDAVIVATVNTDLAEICAAAIRAGKHVLVEKPAAASVREIDALISLADRYGVWGTHRIDLAGCFLGPFAQVAGKAVTHFWDIPVEMGPPESALHEFPGPDDPWRVELAEFEADVRRKQVPQSGLAEARAALQVVETIYQEGGYPWPSR